MIFKPHTHTVKREIHQPPASFYFPGLTSISIHLHRVDGGSGQMAQSPLVSHRSHSADEQESSAAGFPPWRPDGWGRRAQKALSARRFCSAPVALQCASLSGRGQWYSLMQSDCADWFAHLGGQMGFCFQCWMDPEFANKEDVTSNSFSQQNWIFITDVIFTLVWLLL